MRKKIFVFLAVWGLVTACGSHTPLSEEQKVYAGTWVAGGTRVNIYLDGRGDYFKRHGSSKFHSSIRGGAVKLEEGKLQIKLFGICKEFKIDQPPMQVDGKWVMKLDGTEYVKIK